MRGAALCGGRARRVFTNVLCGFLNCNSTGNAGSNLTSPADFFSLLSKQPPASVPVVLEPRGATAPAVLLQMAALSRRQLLGRGVAVRCCFPALLSAPHNRSLIRCKARTRGGSCPKGVSRNFVAFRVPAHNADKIPAIPARGGFGHAAPVSRARADASAAIMQPINERKTP